MKSLSQIEGMLMTNNRIITKDTRDKKRGEKWEKEGRLEDMIKGEMLHGKVT